MMEKTLSTDQLIADLSTDLPPRTAPKAVFSAAFRDAHLYALFALALSAVIGFREDIALKIHDPRFIGEMVYVLILYGFSLLSVAVLSVPDGAGRLWLCRIPYLMAFLFVAAVLFMAADGALPLHFPLAAEGIKCVIGNVLIGGLPLALMTWRARRGASTRPYALAAMSALTLMSLCYMGLRLLCVSDDPGHILFFHVMPAAAAGAVLGVIARRIYAW